MNKGLRVGVSFSLSGKLKIFRKVSIFRQSKSKQIQSNITSRGEHPLCGDFSNFSKLRSPFPRVHVSVQTLFDLQANFTFKWMKFKRSYILCNHTRGTDFHMKQMGMLSHLAWPVNFFGKLGLVRVSREKLQYFKPYYFYDYNYY